MFGDQDKSPCLGEGENRGRGGRAGAEIWGQAGSPGQSVSRGPPDAVPSAPPPRGRSVGVVGPFLGLANRFAFPEQRSGKANRFVAEAEGGGWGGTPQDSGVLWRSLHPVHLSAPPFIISPSPRQGSCHPRSPPKTREVHKDPRRAGGGAELLRPREMDTRDQRIAMVARCSSRTANQISDLSPRAPPSPPVSTLP